MLVAGSTCACAAACISWLTRRSLSPQLIALSYLGPASRPLQIRLKCLLVGVLLFPSSPFTTSTAMYSMKKFVFSCCEPFSLGPPSPPLHPTPPAFYIFYIMIIKFKKCIGGNDVPKYAPLYTNGIEGPMPAELAKV